MSLTRCGYIIQSDILEELIGHNGIKKFKSLFTIKTKTFDNNIKKITAFKHVRDSSHIYYVVLPRFAPFIYPKLRLNNNKLQSGKSITIDKSNLQLTKNQVIVLEHLIKNTYTRENVEKGTGSAILHMDAGHGKSYLSAGLIQCMMKKTFIIVPKINLLRQWEAMLKQIFPSNSIGYYYGKEKKDGDIILGVINSAIKYGDYADIGLIIYDEVHLYCSDSFSNIFKKAQAKMCLGITATPSSRADGFHKLSVWYLGNVIDVKKIAGWENEEKAFVSEVTVVKYSGPHQHTKTITSKMGVTSVPLMLNQLVEDKYRNLLIAKYTYKLYEDGANIYIFSDRLEHLKIIKFLLEKLNIVSYAPEISVCDSITLTGGADIKAIEVAKNEARVILTTYQYTSVGVSIDRMDTIIFATPRRSNMTQILGRIYRLNGDRDIIRRIVDIVDVKTPLNSQFRSRLKAYRKEINATIEIVKKNWTELDN